MYFLCSFLTFFTGFSINTLRIFEFSILLPFLCVSSVLFHDTVLLPPFHTLMDLVFMMIAYICLFYVPISEVIVSS